MESESVSILPKGFDYYAGGHVHIVKQEDFDAHKNVIYPGPTFPNSFSELEKLKQGSMYIYEDGDARFVPLLMKKVELLELDCNHKTPAKVLQELNHKIKEIDVKDSIITVRLHGTLEAGKTSEVDTTQAFEQLYSDGAYFVLKNTNKLQSKEFQSVSIIQDTVEEIEETLIDEGWGNLSLLGADKTDEVALTKTLMTVLSSEKQEGEKVADYDIRIIEQAEKIVEGLVQKT